MADADEATNELIARILAGDADQSGYGAAYEEYGDGECSDDSDFGRPSKKKAKRGIGKVKDLDFSAPKPRRAPVSLNAGDEEFTETGRRKRKDTGAKRETTSKGWSEEEERLFLEALELHGREWHKAAAHVGTRDKKAFTSHAQKHFIKLCIADQPLPQKVVDTGQGSGLGYTLSGYPLDPDSASAKAYGFKTEHLDRLIASGGPGSKGLLLDGKENVALRKNSSDAAGPMAPDQKADGSPSEPAAGAPAAKLGRKPRGQPKPVKVQSPSQEPQEPTDYVKNRPKREGAGMKSKWGHTSESLELVQCKEFMGPPGSGAAQAQPFEVTVDGQVYLVMDFHAHLCNCEIIGLLGGVWVADKRHIHVQSAYPCQRLEGSHSGTSVEVAPEAQVAAQQMMEAAGQVSVGWYHSHPIFAATPSEKDNENQRNQQAWHRCKQTGLEPCLGAIVGPYDQNLPSEASAVSWWVVQNRGNELVPFNVRLKSAVQPPSVPDASLESKLEALINIAAQDPDRINMLQEWRPFRLLVDGQASGTRLTHLMKMRLAISHHLRGEGCDPEKAAQFLDHVFARLRDVWGISQPGKTPNREAETSDDPSKTADLEVRKAADPEICKTAEIEISKTGDLGSSENEGQGTSAEDCNGHEQELGLSKEDEPPQEKSLSAGKTKEPGNLALDRFGQNGNATSSICFRARAPSEQMLSANAGKT